MIDHIHLLVSILPKMSVSSFMGYLKGNRHFWAKGYYVSTVGLNEATKAKYVREQEKHDQMMDRITTKETEDPFRD